MCTWPGREIQHCRSPACLAQSCRMQKLPHHVTSVVHDGDAVVERQRWRSWFVRTARFAVHGPNGNVDWSSCGYCSCSTWVSWGSLTYYSYPLNTYICNFLEVFFGKVHSFSAHFAKLLTTFMPTSLSMYIHTCAHTFCLAKRLFSRR